VTNVTTNDVRDESGRTVEERFGAVEELLVALVQAAAEDGPADECAAWFQGYRGRVRARESRQEGQGQ
jgi:hypothetical protein